MRTHFTCISIGVLATTLLMLSGCTAKKTPESVRKVNVRQDIQFELGIVKDVKEIKDAKNVHSEPEAPVTPAVQINGTLSLDQAITYALAHNLKAAVAKAEEEVQREMSTTAKMKMLPSLIANVERSWKSRDVPSKSENYETGEESLAPSISSELRTATESVELSWDLLDLAINVNRWKQSGDRVKIRAMQLKRIKQNLALDVTRAYMRAVVAKESTKKAEKVIVYAQKRQGIIDNQITKGYIAKIDGLQSSIDIAELLIRLTRYSDEYKASKAELSRLLGIAPNTPYELAEMDFSSLPGELNMTTGEMESEAMLGRPELYKLDAEEQITSTDADIAIMRMFPSLTPFVRYQHDDNKYLTHHDWFVSGLKLSWDMFSLPEAYANKQSARASRRLVRTKRMNQAMAVLTQLRLAVIEYDNYLRQVGHTQTLEKLRKKLAIEVHQQVEMGKLKQSTLLNADQLYIVAYNKRLNMVASLLTAHQRILNSMGRDWGAKGKAVASAAK